MTIDIEALNKKFSDVPHRYLTLSADEGGCHRPELQVWPSADEDLQGAVVTLSVGELMGQGRRYIDMTADEARSLAVHLAMTAALIDGNVT